MEMNKQNSFDFQLLQWGQQDSELVKLRNSRMAALAQYGCITERVCMHKGSTSTESVIAEDSKSSFNHTLLLRPNSSSVVQL